MVRIFLIFHRYMCNYLEMYLALCLRSGGFGTRRHQMKVLARPATVYADGWLLKVKSST